MSEDQNKLVTIKKVGEPTLRILQSSLDEHVRLGWRQVEDEPEAPAATKTDDAAEAAAIAAATAAAAAAAAAAQDNSKDDADGKAGKKSKAEK